MTLARPSAAALPAAPQPPAPGAAAPQPPVAWSCRTLNTTSVSRRGATWAQLSCSSTPIPVFGAAGPLVVNVVSFDLATRGLALRPVAAKAGSLLPLDGLAATSSGVVAGINGPYFYRIDVATFFDGVCIGKNKADALKPVAAAAPNSGIGDGAVVAGGVLLASNCDCLGYSRPAVLTINASSTRIDVLHRGDAPPAGTALDALSAGPNLVTSNASGTFIDIPSDDDNIGNIFEHAANTAFGWAANGTAYMVTTDGFDGCPLLNASCGTNAFTLAYLMRDHFGAAFALSMDQGGSTTMWTSPGGIVSHSGGGARDIFAGLFLAEV